MTPQELIERLESLGLVDSKVLDKIRRQLEDPDKNVKPKAIIKFLVSKDYLTKAQAANLLKAVEAPKAIKHEEIEVSVPQENNYDTDELTATAASEAPAPRKIDPQMTMEAIAVEDDNGDVDVVDVSTQVSLPEEPVVAMTAEPAPMEDPLADNFGNYDGGFYGGGEEAPESAAESALGFQGKRLKKDQWSTKWLYIGFGILGSLLIFGAVLYYAVNRVSAEDQFKAAITSFENQTYGDAIEKLDKFLEDNPKHEKANVAKVRRVQALIAQTYEGKNWDETITRAKNHLPILLDDPDVKMDVIRDDLGVMLPNAALQISDRAIRQTTLQAMEDHLVKAQGAKEVVDNPSYIPNSIRKRTSVANVLDKFNNNILTIEGLIRKENEYKTALTEIKKLSDAGNTDDAFDYFKKLTQRYAELATRDELQSLMKSVSVKERELVKPTSVTFNVSASTRSQIPIETIVLASKNGEKLDANRDLITPVLAEGALYGIDSSDGTVVWRHWVGFESQLQPQLFNPDVLLICDQVNHDLLSVKRMDGSIIWRAEVGEPFMQPAFSDSMVVVTTRSGKVIKLEPETGNVTAACQLPQPANVAAMIAEREPYIYQPGSYANLYVLGQDNLECRDVFYVGHYEGSIQIPPQNWIGHVLLAVNGGQRCDLHILKHGGEKNDLELIQLLNRATNGPVVSPLMRFGRWMLIASELGDMKILQLNSAEDATTPVTKFAEEKFEREPGSPTYMLTRGSQLWIAGKGIMKYKVQANLGKFDRKLIQSHGDRFIGPLTMTEDAIVHVRRREGSGMISVSAVDPVTLKQIWRTDLGGALAGAPTLAGNNLMAVSNQGDVFTIDTTAQTRGIADNAVKSSNIVENLTFSEVVDLGDGKYAVVDPRKDDLLYIDNGQSRLVKLQEPANLIAAKPVGVGGSLIVPSQKGLVVRIEARTGRMMGAPFQPPIRPGVQVDWKDPVLLDGAIFAIGKGSADGTPSAVYLLDGSDGRSIKQVAGVESTATLKSPMAAIDKTVFVVVAADGGDQMVAMDARNGLTSVGVEDLPSGYVAGPWSVGDQLLVRVKSNELICYDASLKQQWQAPMPSSRFAGSPQEVNGSIAIAFQDGQVVWLNSGSGESANAIDIGQPIVNLKQAGDRLLFAGSDGTIHVTQANQ